VPSYNISSHADATSQVVVANLEELGLNQTHKPALVPTGRIVTLLEVGFGAAPSSQHTH